MPKHSLLTPLFSCSLLLLAGLHTAQAATLIADYRLGEADAGAANGIAGNATTTDSSGNGLNLTKSGTATYTNATAPGGALAMAFSNGFYSRGGVLTSVTDNFVLQAWAQSTSLAPGDRPVVYNGNSATSGFGIYQSGASWAVLFGGNVYAPVANSVALNQWTQLTLVRDAGVNTFYINGIGFNVGSGPNAAAGDFFIGGNPLLGTERFAGSIDSVRLLTFAPGTLTAADLSLVPEPATLGLAALALFTTAFLRRRSRA